ncbi:hypothetical protein GCM10010168_93400 [Actinoplanes ianthinogenes]|uniref:Ricin B lectin domain-containing protein n=1 Tax=Actinoplanes ianthinogenes TaxID=122358 RepID=A0ABM7LKH6_9ACTN|nr:hypothetical protein Aiant_04440 [Actinoplanes ianthinogenes]GGR59928.1 hypothetical protein GCM10010168_93400 [Actinoplanes ianthinogenes]
MLVLLMASFGLFVVADGARAQPDAGPAVLAGELHRIRNAGNGLCLQPEDQPDPDPRILQMTCTGRANQAWTVLGNGKGRYWFVNAAGGRCISVGDVPIDHGIVVAGNCTLSDGSGRTPSNAQWVASGSVPGSTFLRSWVGRDDTTFCLDVPGGSPSPGLAVQLYTCNSTLAQKWTIGQ